MSHFGRIFICAGLIALSVHICYAKEWRGIVPLHSTRENVERILRRPDNSGRLYHLVDEVVLISYSKGTCKQGGIWDVPQDTVTAISVSPRKAVGLTELSLNLSSFEVVADKHLSRILYYNNVEDGIHITTAGQTVRSIDYLPAARDEYLRCKKPSSPLVTKAGEYIDAHSLFDSYGSLPFNREKEHLDVFGRKLWELVGARGYIVVYSVGNSTRDVLLRANKAKKYLRRNYSLSNQSIEIIRGGRRDKSTFELYLVVSTS